MNDLHPLKQGLSEDRSPGVQAGVRRRARGSGNIAQRLAGNAHLYIFWASLVQLHEDGPHDHDQARESLQRGVVLDRNSPMASIELGHFLDTDRGPTAERAS